MKKIFISIFALLLSFSALAIVTPVNLHKDTLTITLVCPFMSDDGYMCTEDADITRAAKKYVKAQGGTYLNYEVVSEFPFEWDYENEVEFIVNYLK